MSKDNPSVFVNDSNNDKVAITIEGMLSFSLPKKTAKEMARSILFREERD
jgi:hypothetical protein